MEDWKDPQTAQSWNADQVRDNPLRAEQLDLLLSLVAAEYKPGDTIIDLGIGAGHVEALLFERVPDAQVLGIDSSEPMVALAHARLSNYRHQYSVVMHDLREIGTLQLPPVRYSIAISVQTIHNVEDEHKRETFAFIHRMLAPGGLFLLLDRIAVDTPNLYDVYKAAWSRLNRVHGTGKIEGETYQEHLESVRTRGDLPISLEQHLQWLRDASFEAACLHLHGNRALFAARKAAET